MFISFESLPSTSKIWIYTSKKKIDDKLSQSILDKAFAFIHSWQSHGNDLKGSAQIFHEHFLVIAIDENFSDASGCSIDKSVHFVQELDAAFHLSLMDRSLQGYILDGEVNFFPISDAKKLIQQEKIQPTTLVFNNSITTLADLDKNWLKAAEFSWLGRFFKQIQLG